MGPDEKGLSFHGSSVNAGVIDHVNDALSTMRIAPSVHKPAFRWTEGHYYARMSYDFQKNYEEDAVTEICDVMEAMGWNFKFQYDTSYSKNRAFSGETETSNELFIFHKDPSAYEIFKEDVDTKVGMSLAVDDKTGKIYVSRLKEGSPFELAGVSQGAVVLSINDVPVKGKSAKEAVQLITSKQGMVKVLTY